MKTLVNNPKELFSYRQNQGMFLNLRFVRFKAAQGLSAYNSRTPSKDQWKKEALDVLHLIRYDLYVRIAYFIVQRFLS